MCFIVFALALTKPSSILITIAFIGFGIAALGFIFIIFFDIKNQRRERAAGKKVIWYKRYALFSSSGVLCFMLSETLNTLVANNTLPHTLFFYILIVLFIVCSLCLVIYSLKLALNQRKLAREQLKLLLDRQKAQRSE